MPERKIAGPAQAGGDSSAPPPALAPALAVVGRIAASRLIRWGFVVAATGLACYAIVAEWPQVRGALDDLGFWPLAAALASIMIALAATVQTWRLLLGCLGSPLPLPVAAGIMLVGQIGKYVPGSIWPVLAQMELGRARHVPRSRSASAAILVMLLTLITGLLVALVTLPFVPASTPYRWALLAAPVLLVLLYPRVLNSVIGRLLRLARQTPLEAQLTAGPLLRAMAWSFASWLCYGLQIWILATRLGAPAGKTALVAVGGFAFAWSIGFVVVFAPAGAGVRDVLLLVMLGSVVPTGEATAIVLVSRVLMTVGDLLGAAIGSRFIGRPPASVGHRGVGTDLP